MAEFINKIINYILERRKQKLEKTLGILKPKANINAASKVHLDSNATIVFSAETMKKIEQLDEEVKNIVKPLINTPEKILDYINEHGTKVYRFSMAKTVLDYIHEDEGFLPPLKGFKALWLNLAIGVCLKQRLKFSLKTDSMFVLADGEINVYYMLHQFYKWFGYKSNLPGYDSKAQELFKQNLVQMTDESTKSLTVEEILALKEAIARDKEATEFVINLSKEFSGAKKAHEKLQQDGGAQI